MGHKNQWGLKLLDVDETVRGVCFSGGKLHFLISVANAILISIK